jgi:hypothetical protein
MADGFLSDMDGNIYHAQRLCSFLRRVLSGEMVPGHTSFHQNPLPRLVIPCTLSGVSGDVFEHFLYPALSVSCSVTMCKLFVMRDDRIFANVVLRGFATLIFSYSALP